MKSLAFLMISMFPLMSNAAENPIYDQITRNAPHLSKKYRMALSNIIYRTTRKYNIPADIFTAILMQESGYKLNVKACHQGLNDDKTPGRVCTDFGISQIYYKTARSFDFDLELLTTDLTYSIEAGAKVLVDFKKRYGRRELDWWTRFNASSPIKRQKYKELVERWL